LARSARPEIVCPTPNRITNVNSLASFFQTVRHRLSASLVKLVTT
jgi:hypothetical protein